MQNKYINIIKSILKRIRLRTWIALGIIAILLPIALFTLLKNRNAEAAWFDENWLYRKQLTINDDQVAGSSNLSNFPVLVSSTHSELVTYAQTDGDDILFVDKDGNKLAHEIESFNSGTGALVAWVKVPTLFPTEDTVIYMYFGNPSAANQQNVSGVWDDNYAGVWHLKEDPSGSAPQHTDSTKHNNNGTSNGTQVTGDQAAAKANGGINYDGTNDYTNIPDHGILDLASTGTVEVWAKPDAVTATEGTLSSWTALTANSGTSDNGGSDFVDSVVVGNTVYYVSLTQSGGTETFETATSDLDGSNFSGWTSRTAPDGAGATGGEVSIAVGSDGVKLYYAALLLNSTTLTFVTNTMNFDGTSFGSWTSRTAPSGAVASGNDSTIDFTIVGSTMYFAAYTHTSSTTITYETANLTLDGATMSSWTTQTDPSAVGSTSEAASTAISSNGEKLYYTIYVHDGTNSEFATANSNLDGSGFSAWTTQTNEPTLAGASDPSFIDAIISGDRVYYCAFTHNDTTEVFEVANSALDGSDMTTWTTVASPTVDSNSGESTSCTVNTDGKNLYYVAFGHNGATEAIKTASSPITSHPVVSKTGTYELIQSAGGFTFDWAGVPLAFGSAIGTSNYTYAAVTQDGSTIKTYINAALKHNVTTTTDFAASANPLRIGGDATFFDGMADEVRISSTARSADWLTTTYNSINAPASFITVGSAETGPALALWLKYDEGSDNTCPSGKDACDSSSNANDGTFTGTNWSENQLCVSGTCIHLDGVDDVTTVANATSLDFDSGLSSGVTFQTWVKVDSDGEGNTGEIFDKGASTYMRVTNEGSDGYVDLEASLDLGTTDATATITNGLSVNTWHHVAFTYTDDGDDEITVYIDGISRGASTNGVGSPAGTDTNDLLVGGSSTTNFDGFIDEFKVYQRERTSDEIKVDYTGGAAVLGTSNSGSLSTGLAGYWAMDQASGNAIDQSGNALNLTDTNTVASAFGRFDGGGDFESSASEYMYAADSAYHSLTGDLALAAWIKPESVTAATLFDIVGKWDGTNESYLLAQYEDEIRMYIDSASNYVTTDAANLATGSWYHVVGVYNANKQTVEIFINGTSVAVTTTGTIPVSIGDDAGRFHVGAEDSTTSAANFYDGVIDEVRLYKRAISSGEARQLAEWVPGPKAHWKMDENTGSIVIDSTGNNHDGTFFSAGTTPTWKGAKYGSGLKFDGTDDYFTVDSFSGETLRAFTYSVWYKSDKATVTDDEQIINYYENNDNFVMSPTDDATHTDTIRQVIEVNNNGGTNYYGTTDVVDQTWHHIAVVRTDTRVIIYVDGKEDSNTADSAAGIAGTVNEVLEVGDDPGLTEQVAGMLDDLKIYTYARTPQQILEDMNAGHPTGGSPIGTAPGHWKFDEGANDTCSGGSNDVCNSGTIGSTLDGTSTATRYSSGKLNKALDFDGTDDVVTITNSTAIDFDNNLNDAFTFSTWINPDGAGEGNGGQVFFKGTNTWLRVDTLSGGRLDLQASLDLATTDATLNVSSAVPTGSWSQVALSYTDDDDDEITIWVNGVPLGTSTDGSGAPASTDTNNLLIGGTTTDNFDGKIDEFKVYHKELTRSEMNIDANLGTALGVSNGVNEAATLGDGAGNDPVLYLPLDENTGTGVNFLKDASGNGFLGDTNAAATSWTRGKYGSSIRLNGSTEYIDVDDTTGSALDITTAITAEAWIYSQANHTDYNRIVHKDYTTAWYLGTRNSSTNALAVWINNAERAFTADNIFTNNTWNHVAFTYDSAAGGTEEVKIYVNGIKVATGDYSTVMGTNDTSLGIGGPSAYFTGIIDDVKVYNYARTQAQIAYDYNRGKPVGYWKFDECQGTSANDSSGNSLTGTLTPGASGNTAAGTCGSGTATHMWNDGTTGKYNASIGLDGTDDTVSIGDLDAIDFERTEPFSLSAWIKTSSTSAMTIMSKQADSAPYAGYIFQTGNSTGYLHFILSNTYGTNNVEVRTTNDVNVDDGNWHYVTVTYTGSSAASGVSLYVDGRSVPVTTVTDTLNASIDTATAFHIGSRAGSGQLFNGQIDEARVYNYALSASQVKTLMNNDAAIRFGPSSGTP